MTDKFTIVGKVLDHLGVADDQSSITFFFTNAETIKYNAVGGCCSNTWIEHLELPSDLKGATIIAVEHLDDPVLWDGHKCERKPDGYSNECDHDCLTVMQTLVRTDRGTISIEYRNNSNGYYGGALERDGGHYEGIE
jgi:hypothetical protein